MKKVLLIQSIYLSSLSLDYNTIRQTGLASLYDFWMKKPYPFVGIGSITTSPPVRLGGRGQAFPLLMCARGISSGETKETRVVEKTNRGVLKLALVVSTKLYHMLRAANQPLPFDKLNLSKEEKKDFILFIKIHTDILAVY
jgi:hypothetical protein